MTSIERTRRQRDVSLGWACDLFALGGVHPDVARLAAYGRPQLAHHLVSRRHIAEVAGAAFCADVATSRENYELWRRLWREVAAEARAFLMETAGQ
jgi:hypothetical protein